MFTPKELAYIQSQPLARLATVAADGQPDAAAVGFRFDGQVFHVGGADLPATRKYKNIRGGQTKIALLIDDLVTTDPWNPRGLRVYGRAEIVEQTGMFGPGVYFCIVPLISWSWNIEGPTFVNGQFVTHKTVHHV